MKSKKRQLSVCIVSALFLLLVIEMPAHQVWAEEESLIVNIPSGSMEGIQQNAEQEVRIPPRGFLEEYDMPETEEDVSAGPEQKAALNENEPEILSGYSADDPAGGTCGAAAVWSYEEGVLTIEGTGGMDEYSSSADAPWAYLSSLITSIVVKDGVTSIGKFSFVNLSNVTEVSLPETLTTLGEAAFYGMISLEEIILPSSVQILPSGLFAECSGLKQITYGNITEMERYVFQGTNVETVNIPASLTKIDSLAFFSAHISAIVAADDNPVYTSADGVLYTDNGTTLYKYPSSKEGDFFQIPGEVNKIGDYGFSKAENLQMVDFANVTELGEGAFYDSSLTGELVLSDAIASAGNFTFQDCRGITGVTFGTGLFQTAYSMFENCTGITDIDFGGLQTLGMRSFLGCDGLVSVTLPENMTEWEGSVFNSCRNLETFTSMGLQTVTYADFAQCYALKTVVLDAVEDIYREAFHGCSKLESVTLPATTKYVSETAFPAETKIDCLNSELTPFGTNGLQYAEPVEITGLRDYDRAYEVLEIVNQERVSYGLLPLYMDESLLESAMIRAAECSLLFAHTRPDSTLCMSVNEKMCAENIAMGQRTADSAMDSWMNSKGHRENILNEEYGSIGIGCFLIEGQYYWTQCFSTETLTEDCIKPAGTEEDVLSADIPRDTFTEAPVTSGIIWGTPEEYTYQYVLILGKNSLKTGENTTAKVSVKNPGNSRNTALNIKKNMTFSTSDSSVASVDQEGNAAAKKDGTVKITVNGKYFSASAALKVGAGSSGSLKKTQKMTVTPEMLELYVKGNTKQLVVSRAKGKVTFDNSNPKVIKIDSKGRITPLAKGKAAVIVTAAGNDTYKAASKKINVTVYGKPAKVKNVKAVSSKSKRTLKVSWKKVSSVSGYIIKYSYNKNMKNSQTIRVNSGNNTSKTIKKLTSGKNVYIQVRAYKKDGKAQIKGTWSTKTKGKVK